MKKLLGVTGCPTGIAHTYMAEEALKEAAKKLGAEMKVETNGAVGVENALTAEDIAECDGIIVACDKNVDMKRFNGKKVIEVSVSEGINKAEELVQAMLDGKAPVYGGSEAKAEVKEETVQKAFLKGNTEVLVILEDSGREILIDDFSSDEDIKKYLGAKFINPKR